MIEVKSKRLFIGLGFSNSLAKELEPWLKKLKRFGDEKGLQIKWSPPDNFHVTLVFLGPTSVGDLPTLQEKIAAAVAKHNCFSLKLDGISALPELERGRVVYLDVQRSQKILDLQGELESILGRPNEQGYFPHLTLGRLRNTASCRDFLSPVRNANLGKQLVNSVSLFESIQTGPFSIYKPLQRFDLKPSET